MCRDVWSCALLCRVVLCLLFYNQQVLAVFLASFLPIPVQSVVLHSDVFRFFLIPSVLLSECCALLCRIVTYLLFHHQQQLVVLFFVFRLYHVTKLTVLGGSGRTKRDVLCSSE